jgi:hypothetical protein
LKRSSPSANNQFRWCPWYQPAEELTTSQPSNLLVLKDASDRIYDHNFNGVMHTTKRKSGTALKKKIAGTFGLLKSKGIQSHLYLET